MQHRQKKTRNIQKRNIKKNENKKIKKVYKQTQLCMGQNNDRKIDEMK